MALDVETGGVLALVSTPTYDPNLFVTGISHKNYNQLRDDPGYTTVQPDHSRALPQLTVKPILG